MEGESPYLTVNEACQRLRMGRTRLYGYLGKQLPVTRWGRAVRIHRDDLERFEREQREQAADQGAA